MSLFKSEICAQQNLELLRDYQSDLTAVQHSIVAELEGRHQAVQGLISGSNHMVVQFEREMERREQSNATVIQGLRQQINDHPAALALAAASVPQATAATLLQLQGQVNGHQQALANATAVVPAPSTHALNQATVLVSQLQASKTQLEAAVAAKDAMIIQLQAQAAQLTQQGVTDTQTIAARDATIVDMTLQRQRRADRLHAARVTRRRHRRHRRTLAVFDAGFGLAMAHHAMGPNLNHALLVVTARVHYTSFRSSISGYHDPTERSECLASFMRLLEGTWGPYLTVQDKLTITA